MQFSSEVVRIWNEWEVRLVVLFSLLFQVILIVFGAQRKITARTWIHILVWSAYMTADWVATVALGNLARSQLGDSANSSLGRNYNLQAFWAPFLLLHLGGPDTITAYALEDNELWLRHFLGLLVQVGVAFYIFVRSRSSGALTFLSIPMFITGLIKYGERNFVLRSSGSKSFRDSLPLRPDPCRELVTVIETSDETRYFKVLVQDYMDQKDHDLVQAYFCFERFKYHFANLLLDDKERECIYSTIKDKSATDAFKMVAVELGFMYDVFYTKAAIIYSRLGIVFRCISFICSVSALVVFSIIIDVHAYSLIDISITYVLLVGAVYLEIYAFFLLIFSDWTKVWLIKQQKVTSKSLVQQLWRFIIDSTPPLSNNSRWSRSIGQYNFISSCLRKVKRPGIQKLPFVGNVLDNYWNLTWVDVNTNNLQETIFKFIRNHGDELNRINIASNLIALRELLLAQRGNFILEQKYSNNLFPANWTIDMQFIDSLVIWHIATDLLYYEDLANIGKDDVNELDLKCKVSKYLADYMLYLLVFCPFMLPQGFGVMRYNEACDEAISLFKEKRSHDVRQACKNLLEKYPKKEEGEDTIVSMLVAENQSLLMYACMLSRQFHELESDRQRKWEVISEVWVEVLAYAAYNCGWKEHTQQLRQGGEFLTHIYLVMSHFGLSRLYGGHNLIHVTSPSFQEDAKEILRDYRRTLKVKEEGIGNA